VVDKSVIEWDYRSNKNEAPEHRLMYMLFYQMSRMCREKGAVKHDDRLDCLSQGVQYFTDALSISASEQIKLRQRDEFQDLLDNFLDNPQSLTNHLVLGMDLEQRRKARGLSGKKPLHTWR
jgi:hypothetical protein